MYLIISFNDLFNFHILITLKHCRVNKIARKIFIYIYHLNGSAESVNKYKEKSITPNYQTRLHSHTDTIVVVSGFSTLT